LTEGGACPIAAVADGGRTVEGVPPPQGEGGSTSASCAAQPGDSLCLQCERARCCDLMSTCEADMTCWNLASCETSPTCLGSAVCVSQCEQSYMSAVFAYGDLRSCVTLNCAVCSELGVGDPCVPGGAPCLAGLTCAGAWCTKACGGASDCAGLGPSGDSTLYQENACVAGSSGNTCAPGCTSDADCEAFPGTFCLATTSADRLAVRVCAAAP
jgi:hypothetical protein